MEQGNDNGEAEKLPHFTMSSPEMLQRNRTMMRRK